LVNIFCDVIGSQVIGPFVLQERLTSEGYLCFLEDELPYLLDDDPSHVRRELWLQQGGTPPHFGS